MSSFEYVMVIVSIIIGLGVTTLLEGTVNVIRAKASAKAGLLHGLWVVIMLVQHVGLWSVRWAGQGRDDWPFGVLLAFLLLPIFYYTQAELLFPPEGSEQSLTEYFLDNRRPFFALTIFGYLAAAFGPFVFYGEDAPVIRDMFSWLVLIIMGIVQFYSRNERVHVVLAVLILVGALSSFGIIGGG